MQRFIDYKSFADIVMDKGLDHEELARRLRVLDEDKIESFCNYRPPKKIPITFNSSTQGSTTDESSEDDVFHSSPSTPTSSRNDCEDHSPRQGSSPSPEPGMAVDETNKSRSRHEGGERGRSESSGSDRGSTTGNNCSRSGGSTGSSSGNTTTTAITATTTTTSSSSSGSGSSKYLPLSPLHLAAYEGNEIATALLLSASADPHLRAIVKGFEFSDLTPMEIALQRGHYQVAHMIEAHVRRMHTDNKDDGDVKMAVNDDVRLTLESQMDIDAFVNRGPKDLGIGSEDGYKKPSEDRIVVMPLEIDDMILYAIFDGHNGKHMSEAVSICLPHKIKSAMQELFKQVPVDAITPSVLVEMLDRCFVLLDDEIIQQAQRNFMLRTGGTTAVVVLETRTHLICANVGDSPAAVFDATTGQILVMTEDHVPANAKEIKRVLAKGGTVVPNPEYGDLRMRSPSKRSTVSVTRAFGQYEFKAGLHPDEYVLMAKPQCYIWSKVELMSQSEDPANSKLFFALYSDSFTEAVVDSFNVGALPHGSRAPQVIANVVPHHNVVAHISVNLRNADFHCSVVAQTMAQQQALRFHIGGSFCGDNTSLLLVKL